MTHKLAGFHFTASSVEEYEALQVALFAEGCIWASGTQDTKNEYYSCDEVLGVASIEVGRSGRMLRGRDGQQGTVQYTSAKVTAEILDSRPRIQIKGKTYVLADVEAAMSVFGVSEAAL